MGGILIVEDCADTRRLIERALSGQFALRHADDLATARTALAEARPELVLLDIGLPDGDGMALCSELRSDESTRAIPVIFLSSRNGGFGTQPWTELGVVDVDGVPITVFVSHEGNPPRKYLDELASAVASIEFRTADER